MLFVEGSKYSRHNVIDRSITKILYPGWEKYRTICKHPDVFRKLIPDNPLLVVHPGYNCYVKVSNNFEILRDEYNEYLDNLKDKISRTIEERRSVIVFTPSKNLKQTQQVLNSPEGIVFVPTLNKSVESHSLILLEFLGQPFYKLLSQNISQAEVCGEFGSFCVLALAKKIADSVDISLISNCIFPKDFRNDTDKVIKIVKFVRSLSLEDRKTKIEEYSKGEKTRVKIRIKTERKTGKRIVALEDFFLYFSKLSDKGLDNLIHNFSI